MSSADGPHIPGDTSPSLPHAPPYGTIECQLFESLVHHLIEKGVLTKNDALSVVQTVAQVTRGTLETGPASLPPADNGIAILKRLYASFELMPESNASRESNGANVLQLRPPLHGDRPEFPRDD